MEHQRAGGEQENEAGPAQLRADDAREQRHSQAYGERDDGWDGQPQAGGDDARGLRPLCPVPLLARGARRRDYPGFPGCRCRRRR